MTKSSRKRVKRPASKPVKTEEIRRPHPRLPRASEDATHIGPNLSSRTRWILLACILALGAWFRIVAIENTVVDHPIRADATEYYLSAYNLVFHGVYTKSRARLDDPKAELAPDSYRSPGLPLVIAAFMPLTL